MKKLNLLFFTLFLSLVILGNARAQQMDSLNELAANQVHIFRNKDSAKGKKFNVLDPPARLVAAFGVPKSKTVEFAEMDQVHYTVYRYEGGEFAFDKNALAYLRIFSPVFSVCTQTPPRAKEAATYTYRVGDQLNRLKALYPHSYQALNSDGVLSFWLYQLKPAASAQKTIKTQLLNTLAFFSRDGVITDFVMDH